MTTADGRVLRAVKVVDHGDSAARFDLVVLSEGYTRAELDAGAFSDDVDELVEAIFAAEPFDDPVLQSAVNVWRIDVTSTDSGADDPMEVRRRPDPTQPEIVDCQGGLGTTAATYFDATYCVDSRLRRALAVNTATVLAVVDDQVPLWDVAMVVVNSSVRGGTGGTAIPVLSNGDDMTDVALHELGHAAFGLADEYEFRAGCLPDGTALDPAGERDRFPVADGEPREPNVTIETDRSRVKWRHLIAAGTDVPTTRNPDCTRCDPRPSPVAAGTVGLFEGAKYYHCDSYRPVFDCRMRRSDRPFCPVCSERIRDTLRLFAPARKKPMDFTVITSVRNAFGDEQGSLPGVFVGASKDFTFDCPGIDPNKDAVLTFQALSVDSEKNVFRMNDRVVFGDLPKTTSTAGGWSAQTALITPGTLKPRGNVLHVEARTTGGATSGNIDDFVLDNVVLFYKTT
jgi:hypothetical protein